MQSGLLTDKWTELRPHAEQRRFWESDARFIVVPSGRRSGKTEIAKRKLIRRALAFTKPDGWFVFGAPTYNQAKRIYWKSLKDLIPRDLRIGKPRASDLAIELYNGARIQVMGMEAPERVEGEILDGIALDEYANMKQEVWTEHVRPALSSPEREGWAMIYGVPEGRNHYYDLARHAQSQMAVGDKDWAYFHWLSEDILSPAEIISAKAMLDPQTYDQEYRGSFVMFSGRAYYSYRPEVHSSEKLTYDPDCDLIFAFDFNRSPGVCAVMQEQEYKGKNKAVKKRFTAVIGEVWIPRNSNTPMVCRKLIHDWGEHTGRVLCYGDASGGAKGSAKVQGSDWDLIYKHLEPAFPSRLMIRVPKANPRVRVRINSVNSRCAAVNGSIAFLVDSQKAKHVARDLEGVTLKKGTAGELDKTRDDKLTHISDAIGYYLAKEFPAKGLNYVRSIQM